MMHQLPRPARPRPVAAPRITRRVRKPEPALVPERSDRLTFKVNVASHNDAALPPAILAAADSD